MVRDTPVRVYVTGAAGLARPARLAAAGRGRATLYLRPAAASRGRHPTGSPEPSRYRYDPADPRRPSAAPMLLERKPVRDNRPLEARDDVLTFTSEPLRADVEAIGPVSADIRLRSSRGDTDVFVRVCDVEPDGASLNVCDALVRLTPRRAPSR